MNKIVLFFMIFVGVILIFYISSYFNFAIFDIQCYDEVAVCSSDSRIEGTAQYTDFQYPESECFKDCKVRNFRCGYDLKFKENCLGCIDNCREESGLKEFPQGDLSDEQLIDTQLREEKLLTCSKKCY
ncbi:hypothetical protein HY637_05345 [Candidatus Woesearchaeota archaeon]|nr:hypothetical protein [Candidatus Woesearchaeota archaeon]